MSTTEAEEVADVLGRIRRWSPALRITLARRILETVEAPANLEEPPRRIPLDQIVGMLKTDAPPPTDEECARIIEFAGSPVPVHSPAELVERMKQDVES